MLQGHVLCGCVLGTVCCRDMFCAGRVPEEDLKRTLQACGGCIQSTVASLEKDDTVLGTCALFEEKQVGGDRYVVSLSSCKVRDLFGNAFSQCAGSSSFTDSLVESNINMLKHVYVWKNDFGLTSMLMGLFV